MNVTAKKLIDIKKNLKNVSKTPISTSGNFGVVHRGIFVKNKNHKEKEEIECAVKYMKTKYNFSQDFDLFHREISAQNSLKHPALLPLLGFYIPFCGAGKLTIVTPFMKNGSIYNVIANERKSMSPGDWCETKRAISIIGIAAGMKYMHQNNMIHRDLKTENILLDEMFYPKICDFGLSKVFEDGLDKIVNATICGTEPFMAPELLFRQPYNSKVDVFAYALIVFELIELQSAFQSSGEPDFKKYIASIQNGTRPNIDEEKFGPFFKDLVSNCWEQDPNNRPTFDEILESLIEAYKNQEIFTSDTVDRDEIDEYIRDVIDPNF